MKATACTGGTAYGLGPQGGDRAVRHDRAPTRCERRCGALRVRGPPRSDRLHEARADPVARTVHEYEPGTVGVPLRTPLADNDNPVGKDPVKTAYDTPYVADNWMLVIAAPLGTSAYAPPADNHTG